MDDRKGWVDEQEGPTAFRLIPRLNCEEVVRAKLRAAIPHGCNEQAHLRLPGEIARVPETGIAACHALAFEQTCDLPSLIRQSNYTGYLGTSADDTGDVGRRNRRDGECYNDLRAVCARRDECDTDRCCRRERE